MAAQQTLAQARLLTMPADELAIRQGLASRMQELARCAVSQDVAVHEDYVAFADIKSLQLWIAAAETCVRSDPRAAAPVVAEQEAVGEKRKARA